MKLGCLLGSNGCFSLPFVSRPGRSALMSSKCARMYANKPAASIGGIISHNTFL